VQGALPAGAFEEADPPREAGESRLVTSPGRFRRIFAVAALSAAAAARADDADKAREHYSAGLRAFDLGKYDEAIEEFERAYRQKDAPGLLYNIGQAYRLSNRPQDAIRFYQRYLAQKPDASNRAEVLAKIDRLQGIVEEQKKLLGQHPERFLPTPLPPVPQAAPEEAVAKGPPAPEFWTRRKGALLASGAGASALAFGIVFALKAQSSAAQVEGDAAARRPFDPAAESSGRSAQVISRLLLAAGLAGLACGGILYWTPDAVHSGGGDAGAALR
jgi:tetratricopeptide (TPR) repeat protein